MQNLAGYRTERETLLPIMDIYLNRPCEVWVYNSNARVNKDLDNWLQTKMTCRHCGFVFVERLIGEGHKQKVVEVNGQKLLKEEYKCRCPYCHHVWPLNATRKLDYKTLAPDAGDDLNEAIQEVDDELKGE